MPLLKRPRPGRRPGVRWFERILALMTGKQFFDWQTSGGTDDVMRLVDCLERADVSWCCIGGVAVNHWAAEPMVTRDVDLVIALDAVDRVVGMLTSAGFTSERFAWSVNLRGHSTVSIQLSTEDFYRDFPSRAVPADVHGILMRVASLDDTLAGKMKALEHLLRYCARPPFALHRLSVIRGEDGRIARVRYVLPRHKAANWVGPGRGRKSTRPGANGVVELSPFEFLDRLADLVPPPRKHRHRYHLAVSRPVCADEKNPALSVDRKLLGTSKRASHPARSVPAVASS
jgi:hypothetical protein